MRPRNKLVPHARRVAIAAMMAAILELSKLALSWLANVELVTFFVLLFACYWGWRALLPTFVFVGLEILVWGFGLWTFSYFYVWPLLAVLGVLLRHCRSAWIWALVGAFFGLSFGALCAIPYLLIGGPRFAVTWWLAGIPYDLVHCGGNFFLILALWKPMSLLMQRMEAHGLLN